MSLWNANGTINCAGTVDCSEVIPCGATSLTLNPNAVNSSSVSLNPIITFISELILSPNVVNSNSIALNPILSFASAQTIGTVMASFAPDLFTVKFKE